MASPPVAKTRRDDEEPESFGVSQAVRLQWRQQWRWWKWLATSIVGLQGASEDTGLLFHPCISIVCYVNATYEQGEM